MKLGIIKLHPDVVLPEYATDGAACFDLRFFPHGDMSFYAKDNTKNTCTSEWNHLDAAHIEPGDRAMLPTGMAFDIPEGYSMRLHSRSSLALKQGLRLANSEGVIDSDYVNEVFVVIHNTSSRTIVINKGDRIAQAELVKNIRADIYLAGERILKQKGNRTGGFGSTGK